jgi:hypothetical protein
MRKLFKCKSPLKFAKEEVKRTTTVYCVQQSFSNSVKNVELIENNDDDEESGVQILSPSSPGSFENVDTIETLPENSIFAEDSAYGEALDALLNAQSNDLWKNDELTEMLRNHKLDQCPFNDETPALFMLLDFNEEVEDFAIDTNSKTTVDPPLSPAEVFDELLEE